MPEGQFTQDNRFLSLTTPLGKDVLLLSSFMVSERLSAPYTIELDVLYKGKVNPADLLGKPVSFSVAMHPLESDVRHFHGIVNEVNIGGETERFRNYRLVVVPKLWLLTLNRNFRVFEQKSVPDILQEVLNSYGIKTRFSLGGYTKWDFCFQYRESDFNFISRLMEEEGMFYFFEHTADSHTMVIADAPSAFKPSPLQTVVRYAPEFGAGDEDFLMTWEQESALKTGAHAGWDWHFENAPNPTPATVNTAEAVAGNTAYKISDFPGRFAAKFNKIASNSGVAGEAATLNKKRMEEIETENPLFHGTSNCKAFNSGTRFTVEGSEIASGDYVITSIEHSGTQAPPYLSGMEAAALYANSMNCITYGSVYRPPRTARRSLVHGPQTAIVTEGPDKYGRMRVKFHWGDRTTSGWLRVAQRWAGPQWGTIFLPRVGHEVIIDFIDGDPDQPLIVGSLYNKQNMPPYTLPDNYTQCGIKTRSMTSDGGTQGGADEFNELRFEDKQGSEDIYFHAQKDFHRVVENDDDLKVGHDQTIEIKNHRTETVKDGDEKVTIEKGKRSVFVNTGDDLHQVKMGNREKIVDMGNDTLTVKMGNHIRKISLGKSETEAMQSIELKVGANSIKIDQTGITLKGIMIKFEGTAMIQSKAPMQQMNGDAMVIIKGGLTMIN
jgi:type VI secretion system secreted protein VgrG